MEVKMVVTYFLSRLTVKSSCLMKDNKKYNNKKTISIAFKNISKINIIWLNDCVAATL